MPFVFLHPIESSRLHIRLVVESDLPDLLAINGDDEVTQFLGHPSWDAMAHAEAWFARISALQVAGTALEFVLIAKNTGKLLGRCALFEFEEANTHATLGYVLGRAHWKQGYMREALTTLLDHAFGAMGLRRLEAKVEHPNFASANLLKHLGFLREGVLRERWLTDGEAIDAEVYGLLRREWLAAERGAAATGA